MLQYFSSCLSFTQFIEITFKITFPNIDDKFYLDNYLDWQDILSRMLSRYRAFQMLVSDVSTTLVTIPCVPTAFALFFISLWALFLLWMTIQC